MDNSDLIDTLNSLVSTCKDGEIGFQTSAEHVKSENLRSVFLARAQECRQAASELRALIQQHGGKPDDGGTATGAMHRGWVAVKGTIAGYSDLTMLEECERGEDAALERYRMALEKPLQPLVRALVERQYEGVKRNHVQIRSLRDTARAMT